MPICRIGLTGGIGSGKSTVAAIWVSLGAMLVDTDAIAREITSPGGLALPALTRQFGADIVGPDGALDRVRMREMAFSDSAVRLRLENELHPIIGRVAMERALNSTAPVVVFDVPLLSESSVWRERCDRILVVDCREATQIDRVMRRSGWSAAQVHQVIAQQATRTQRRAIADAVVHNDDGCSAVHLTDQIGSLWRLWVGPQR